MRSSNVRRTVIRLGGRPLPFACSTGCFFVTLRGAIGSGQWRSASSVLGTAQDLNRGGDSEATAIFRERLIPMNQEPCRNAQRATHRYTSPTTTPGPEHPLVLPLSRGATR